MPSRWMRRLETLRGIDLSLLFFVCIVYVGLYFLLPAKKHLKSSSPHVPAAGLNDIRSLV